MTTAGIASAVFFVVVLSAWIISRCLYRDDTRKHDELKIVIDEYDNGHLSVPAISATTQTTVIRVGGRSPMTAMNAMGVMGIVDEDEHEEGPAEARDIKASVSIDAVELSNDR